MALTANALNSDLPDLPEFSITKEGFVFDPREIEWKIRSLVGEVKLRFDVMPLWSEQNIRRAKLAFCWLLENNSSSHASNLHQNLVLFHRTLEKGVASSVESFEVPHLSAFKATLSKTQLWKLGVLRILLNNMHNMGLGVTSVAALTFLNDLVLPGNVKGTSIRTRDPSSGAFSDIELSNMMRMLNDSYASGKTALYHFAACCLLMAYGSRAIQIAALKESDLLVSNSHEGKFYALKIPRAKQPGQDVRQTFKTRYCGRLIGQLLETVIAFNRANRPVEEVEQDWPIFMAKVHGGLPDLAYHMTSSQIARMVSKTIRSLTGLKGNTKRFRITLGQRAADDGKDVFAIAEILDHSDTQQVAVYVEATSSMVKRLDRHLAMELAPVAQAFAGMLVRGGDEAKRGDDPASHIYDRSLRDNVSRALGNCGQMSFCGLAAPIACYTCRHFQPWLDGPHDEFLAALVSERDRMIAEGYAAKIYSIRDRTILAIAQVIQMCAERLSNSAGVPA